MEYYVIYTIALLLFALAWIAYARKRKKVKAFRDYCDLNYRLFYKGMEAHSADQAAQCLAELKEAYNDDVRAGSSKVSRACFEEDIADLSKHVSDLQQEEREDAQRPPLQTISRHRR